MDAELSAELEGDASTERDTVRARGAYSNDFSAKLLLQCVPAVTLAAETPAILYYPTHNLTTPTTRTTPAFEATQEQDQPEKVDSCEGQEALHGRCLDGRRAHGGPETPRQLRQRGRRH